MAELNVRMIQPGRTRVVFAHVLLSPCSVLDFEELDDTHARAEDASRAAYPNSFVDIRFTGDPRFAAPFQGSRSMPTIESVS